MNSGAPKTLRSADDLAAAGLIAKTDVEAINGVGRRYAIALTPAMTELIAREGAPIARQFVPDRRELVTTAEERADPIGDAAHEVTPGLIHRYPDRVLLKLVSACAVYCRFCFRRESVGNGAGNLGRQEIGRALAYIRAHADIWEVILSGGDPLMASPGRLGNLLAELGSINHVRVARIHTRIPVVAPEMITDTMAAALGAAPLSCWMAIHVNHRSELTQPALAALGRLRAAGVHLVSQTVLLRGVNDDVDTLADLMRALVEAGIKPYYLHHPDLAPGTGHFRVSIERGQALVEALGARVSGLCQPVYVLDIPGGAGKVPIGASAFTCGGERPVVRDRAGGTHSYAAWGSDKVNDR